MRGERLRAGSSSSGLISGHQELDDPALSSLVKITANQDLIVFQWKKLYNTEHSTQNTADCGSTLGRVEQGLLVALDGRDSRDGADIFLDQAWV